jgi:hypothetical protein
MGVMFAMLSTQSLVVEGKMLCALELSRSLLNLAERGGRASYPQFTAVRGIPT